MKGFRIPGSRDRRVPIENLLSFMQQYEMPLDNLFAFMTEHGIRNPVRHQTARVLIVSRDKANEVLVEALRSATVAVELAANAFAVGTLWEKLSPNVLILDTHCETSMLNEMFTVVQSKPEQQTLKVIALIGDKPVNHDVFDAKISRTASSHDVLQTIRSVLQVK